MAEDVLVKPCPPNCDWPAKGFHLEREVIRLSVAVETACGRLEVLHTQLEALINANRLEMDVTLRRYIDETTRQVTQIATACQANADSIAGIKMHLARNVAIFSSIAAGVISLAGVIVEKVF